MQKNNHLKPAFTLIETILYLALTGAMVFLFFLMFNNNISNAQFKAAVEDVRAHIELEYTSLKSGISDGVRWDCQLTTPLTFVAGSQAGDSSNCVDMGSLLTFTEDQVKSETVVGKRLKIGTTGLLPDLLQESTPTVYSENSNRVPLVKDYSNGLTLKNTKYEGFTRDNLPIAIGFIRSPTSNQIYSVAYLEANLPPAFVADGTTVDTANGTVSIDNVAYNTGGSVMFNAAIQLCFTKSDEDFAMLKLNEAKGGINIEVDYNVSSC